MNICIQHKEDSENIILNNHGLTQLSLGREHQSISSLPSGQQLMHASFADNHTYNYTSSLSATPSIQVSHSKKNKPQSYMTHKATFANLMKEIFRNYKTILVALLMLLALGQAHATDYVFRTNEGWFIGLNSSGTAVEMKKWIDISCVWTVVDADGNDSHIGGNTAKRGLRNKGFNTKYLSYNTTSGSYGFILADAQDANWYYNAAGALCYGSPDWYFPTYYGESATFGYSDNPTPNINYRFIYYNMSNAYLGEGFTEARYAVMGKTSGGTWSFVANNQEGTNERSLGATATFDTVVGIAVRTAFLQDANIYHWFFCGDWYLRALQDNAFDVIKESNAYTNSVRIAFDEQGRCYRMQYTGSDSYLFQNRYPLFGQKDGNWTWFSIRQQDFSSGNNSTLTQVLYEITNTAPEGVTASIDGDATVAELASFAYSVTPTYAPIIYTVEGFQGSTPVTYYLAHGSTPETTADALKTTVNNATTSDGTFSYVWSFADGLGDDGHSRINVTDGHVYYHTWYDATTTRTVQCVVTHLATGLSYTAQKVVTFTDGTMLPPSSINTRDGNMVVGEDADGSDYYILVSANYRTPYHYVSATSSDPTVVSVTNDPATGRFTVNALAIGAATITVTSYENDNTTTAATGTFTITVRANTGAVTQGTTGDVVTLNDLENHLWKYYNDATQPVHRLNPADVKITYYGNSPDGRTTMTNASETADAPTSFSATATGVQVGPQDGQHTFVYHKTLERANEDGSGNLPYTTIPNPFQVRPTYNTGVAPATTRTIYISWSANNWTYNGTQAYVGYKYTNASGNEVTVGSTSATRQNGNATITAKIGTTITLYSRGSRDPSYTNARSGYRPTINAYYGTNNSGTLITSYQATGTTETNTSFTVEAEIDNAAMRGFYAWRIKSLSDGLSISGKSVGDIIPADEEIEFVTSNEYGNEVEFEALWAQAYVTTGTSDLSDYVPASVTSAYERNFHVLNSTENASSFQKSYPCTVIGRMPNSTSLNATRTISGTFTAAADTKFEDVIFSGSNTYTANTHDLIVGRGCTTSSGTNTVRGVGGGTSGAVDYTIRLESGTFGAFYLMSNGARTHSGTFKSRAIFGCDFDRATNTNTLLTVAASAAVTGGSSTQTFSSAYNRNNTTAAWIVKSGTIQRDHAPSNGTAAISMYLSNTNGTTNRYHGRRTLTIEGGELCNVAGGVDQEEDYADYAPNDGESWRLKIRMKGGTVRGSVYGAAEFAAASLDRIFVFTGGSIRGWVAGGANGTRYTGGVLTGSSYIYVGGNCQINSNESTTVLNSTVGGNLFAAGCGFSNGSNSGQVTGGTTVVLADNAYVERGVYGGGGFGYTTATSNVYIIGGTVDCKAGGVTVGSVNGTGDDATRNNVQYSNAINGGVYGGACQNQAGINNVFIKGGTVNGDVYGGSNYSGDVSGAVNVKVYGGTVTGAVYGCNNHGGAPQSSVNVDVYGTDNHPGDGINYAIGAVYGGGNQANYGRTPVVTVHGGCATPISIGEVYGGGNQATVTGTNVSIYGGDTIGSVYAGANSANVNGNATLNVYGGTIRRVFPGNNNSGSITGSVTTTINTGVVESGSTRCPMQIGAVFGGGNLASSAYRPVNIVCTGEASEGIDTLFGGANKANITSDITLNVAHGHIRNGIFGGNNESGTVQGDVTVNITDDGVCSFPYPTIFGGGFGENTVVRDNVEVNIGVANTPSTAPSVNGDIYGGSALGTVNSSASQTTTVNINNGTVNGNIYGGALGRNADTDNGITEIAAKVNGVVTVNVGTATQTEAQCAIDLRNASVYGGNNTNGSPQQDVTVHIYRTGNITGDYDGTDFSKNLYAIDQVFGGGNQADYAPEDGSASSTKRATVWVHNCFNSVRRLFGGGNAAAAVGVITKIDGGRYDWVFGGGNGEVTAANVGDGGTNLRVYGGNINHLFGGSNQNGDIAGDMRTLVTDSGSCGTHHIGEFFGGGNLATISKALSTTIDCGTGYIERIYGGSKQAAVNGNVTLNINGGTFDYVFGGSQGTETTAANIDGNVTLNITGGDINNAFGGNDVNGNITGKIAVTVDWTGNTCAQQQLDNVYGASNLAIYNPTVTLAADEYSPLVTIKKCTVGRTTARTAEQGGNPVFDVEHLGDHGRVFGTGKGSTADVNAGMVTGNAKPKVLIDDDNAKVLYAVYGGGETAIVNGNTLVELNNGHIGSATKDIDEDNGYVFGGGKGSLVDPALANVTGTATVRMTGGYVHNTLFGGGEMASVGTFTYASVDDNANDIVTGEPNSCADGTGLTSVYISGGQIGPHDVTMTADLGYVFGAGMGVYTQPFVMYTEPTFNSETLGKRNARYGYVNNSYVQIDEGALIIGAVWGGSENGQVMNNCHVVVNGGQIGMGAGKSAPYTASQWNTAINAVRNADASAINSIAADMTECTSWPYKGDEGYGYRPYDAYIDQDITDGAVAEADRDASTAKAGDGHTFFGNVFGGGSGYYPYRITEGGEGHPKSVWYQFQGRVRGNTQVDINGGHVLTSVYGGCEYADVIGKCTINMKGGTIGVPRTLDAIEAHPVTCYLFGAGKGDQRTSFNDRNLVGSVEVNVSGGTIFGSIFGGGEDGHVHGDVTVNVTANTEGNPDPHIGTWGTSYVDGNIFGAGRGFGGTALTAGSVSGNVTVNISAGTMLGSVYGGGRLASVGLAFVHEGDPLYGRIIDIDVEKDDDDIEHGRIRVNISGNPVIGNDFEQYDKPTAAQLAFMPHTTFDANNRLVHTTGGNVFGSNMGRVILLDGSYSTIWPGFAKARRTIVTIDGGTAATAGNHPVIKGNVYGGGELGYVMRNASVTIGGYAEIGRQLKDGSSGTLTDAYIGSVYGGGYGSEDVHESYNDSCYWEKDDYSEYRYITAAQYAGATASGYNQNTVTPAMHSGRVYGSTDVTIKDNSHVWGNVYGGGEMASVGMRWVLIKDKDTGNPRLTTTTGSRGNVYYLDGSSKGLYDEIIDNERHGTTTVTITGGTIGNYDATPANGRYVGKPAGDKGYVFGGGKGKPSDGTADHAHYTRMAYVDRTHVDINEAVAGTMHIAGSVFGGGENGHVRFDTDVKLQAGTVGMELSDTYSPSPSTKDSIEHHETDGQGAEIYFGNVYGGGRGIDAYLVDLSGQSHYSLTAGKVYRNTSVTITGGRATHNVYGGGSLASVGLASNEATGNATVTITGGVIGYDDSHTLVADTSILYYETTATPYSSASTDQQNTIKDFYLRAGINEGRVYGGGRGHAATSNDDADYRHLAFVKNTNVTIGDGTGTNTAYIRGSVFGGGANGHVRRSTHVSIQQGALVGVPLQSADSWNLGANYKWKQSIDGFISYDTLRNDQTSLEYYEAENYTNGAHLHEHWETADGSGPTIYRGNVYAGGRGITPTDNVGSTIDQREYSATAGRVYGNANLTISGGRIFHNVYGGGSLASVGDTVASVADDGKVTDMMGYLIADGTNTYTFTGEVASYSGTDAYGTDYSTLLNGKYHFYTYNGDGTDGSTQMVDYTRAYRRGDPVFNTGTATITVTGGVIGTDGINDGHLFGSGRGIAGSATAKVIHLANVTNTFVNIQGGQVRGVVFGGGANGHVLQNTHVSITGGIVGVPLSLAERKVDEATGHGHRVYRGNVYGGGRGVDPIASDDEHISHTAGRVYGNTILEVSGGLIYHSIYGGGSLASVGSSSLKTIDGDKRHLFIQGTGQAIVTVSGNAHIGHPWQVIEEPITRTSGLTDEEVAMAKYLLVQHYKNYPNEADAALWPANNSATVDASWNALGTAGQKQKFVELNYHFLGSNSGSVFGSGRGVGALISSTLVLDYVDAAFTRNTIVTVKNTDGNIPVICGSVFGGGENGHVKHHTLVNIEGGVIGALPLHDQAFVTNSNSYGIGLTGSGYSSYKFSNNTTPVTLDLQYEDSENAAGHGPAIYRGNVYGGGRGVDHSDAEHPENGYSATAGRVHGNVVVNIKGGMIYHHVFGGGSLASVGTFSTEAGSGIPVNDEPIYEYKLVWDASDYDGNNSTTRAAGKYAVRRTGFNSDYEPDSLFVLAYASNGGKTGDITVNVNGGQVGVTGINEGSVYGGGRGIAGENSDDVTHLAYCDDTHVNIHDGADIRGNVFGGGANGHVLTDAHVTMDGGTVGAELTSNDKMVNIWGEPERDGALYTVYHGNVYGGGRGVDPIQSGTGNTFSYTAGRVYGNTFVEISGGTVRRNVYGGGSLATVGTMRYKNSESDVDANGFGSKLAPTAYDQVGRMLYVNSNGDSIGTTTVTITGNAVIGDDGMNNGRVFGSCRGMAGRNYSGRAFVRKATVNIMENCVVAGSVFGSGENGHVGYGGTFVNVSGGTIGQDVSGTYASMSDSEKKKYDYIGNVYGGGRGVDFSTHTNGGVDERWNSFSAGYVRGNTNVNITGGTIYRNVYGGGSMGTVGDYGPRAIDDGYQGDGTTSGVATVNIASSVGTAACAALGYGGNVFGSARGRANDPASTTLYKGAADTNNDGTPKIHGYFGEMSYVFKSIVNVGKTAGGTPSDLTVYGSVYGGGENGHVDYGGTTVNILSGTVKKNVFGGGAGSTTSPTAGIVDGNTQVNIGSSTTYGEATIEGAVFGGNDTYSSPLGVMRVDVYKTYRTAATSVPAVSNPVTEAEKAALDASASTASNYALNAVYGGGNKANVLTGTPATDASDGNASNVLDQIYSTDRIQGSWNVETPRKSVVYVHGCENTIMYVYGGGNAANTIQNDVTIEGGRMYQVFAGGNGYSATDNHNDPSADNYNPGADVGMSNDALILGTTSTTAPHSTDKGDALVSVEGGIIYQTFGGSNSLGMIYGTSTVDITEDATCQRLLTEVYGGGNEADGGTIVITLPCQDNTYIPVFYAGANNANIGSETEPKNIHLIINGGEYGQVFGGNNHGGTVYGNITVDVFGGTIHELFGGNNAGGNVKGNIIVNVDSTDTGCPMDLDYVYGGGYNAPYTPTDATIIYPAVNIKQGTVNQAVFGGGYGAGATVTANPYVTVGDVETATQAVNQKSVRIGNPAKAHDPLWGYVFGGGNAASVSGNTTVKVVGKTVINSNVYGGGNAASVSGNTDVVIGE